MTALDIIKGLLIIEQARPLEESPYHIRAEHDRIYVGSLEWEISEENQKILEELGWDKDEDADGWTTMV